MISVKKIHDRRDLKTAQQIRHEVFVIGQKVPVEDEIDVFEMESNHYLAFLNNNPVGAARWRNTEKGIKLERFAVLESYRGRGVGTSMVQRILKDIKDIPENRGKIIYLHAQLDAIPLYRKFGFVKYGDMFDESGLMHYSMRLEE